MRNFLVLLLSFIGLSAMAQLPPIVRTPWTTNQNGGGVSGLTNVNALTFSGLSSGNWTNIIDTKIADATDGALMVTVTATNTIFGVTNEADFPYGFSVSSTAWAKVFTNTLWVSYIGNDSTAQKNNPYRPWATIAAALTNVGTADTIHIVTGDYNESLRISNSVRLVCDLGVNVNSVTLTNTSSLEGRGTITNLFVTSDTAIRASAESVPTELTLAGSGEHKVDVGGAIKLITLGVPVVANCTNYIVTCKSVTGDGTRHVRSADTTGNASLDLFVQNQTGGFIVDQTSTSVGRTSVRLKFQRMWGVVKPYIASQTISNSLSMAGWGGMGVWRDGQIVDVTRSKTGRNPYLSLQNIYWFIPDGSNGMYTLSAGTASTNRALFGNVWINAGYATVTNGGVDQEVIGSWQTVTGLGAWIK